MKHFDRYYTKQERRNLIINTLVLLIFIGYSVYLILGSTDIVRILFLLFILVVFTGAMVLKEILNFHFQKAIYQLTHDCDPLLAFETMKKVRKYDFLKGYTLSFVAFSSLVYIDTENPEALLELFAPDNKLTQTGKDMILIKNYSLYKAYVLLNNRTQMKKAYAELIRLKALRVKGKGLSPLYAWFDIEAEYALLTNDVKEASSILSKANTSALNAREKAHHLALVAAVEVEKGNIKDAKSIYEEIISIANKMSLKERTILKLKELKNEKTQKAR
jgi:tetratricopeptide (TPR) repeat protein